jgi:NAD-dependent dihydropyrimidine dehydrogenase PreA subunit
MAFVIAEPCIGTKDTACVDACPVDCIHPKKNTAYEDGRPSFDEVEKLYMSSRVSVSNARPVMRCFSVSPSRNSITMKG